jgi:hypothetical protein
LAAVVMQWQGVGGSAVTVSAADEDCVGERVGRAGRGRDGAFLDERGRRPRNEEGRKAAAAAQQGRQRRPRGEEGSGGRAARKAAAAARARKVEAARRRR